MNRLHLYTGDGKGKTTAAMGLALRRLGHGGRVLIGQFLKDGFSGELSALRQLPGATVLPCPPMEGFLSRMTAEERSSAERAQAAYLHTLICTVEELQPDCIILDELAAALALSAVPEQEARTLIEASLRWGETVVTGAFTPAWLRDRADYVTCMRAERHPYQTQQLPARKGVEW